MNSGAIDQPIRMAMAAIAIALFLPILTPPVSSQGPRLAVRPNKQPARPTKQIYEVSTTVMHSEILNADGVAAYVVSSMGTNRGFLVKQASTGLASRIGISPGDIVLSFNDHVIEDGRAADRVLSSLPNGNVKVMFVHPNDGSLQLYNGAFRYVNQGPLMGSAGTVGVGGTEPGRPARSTASNEIEFSPAVESYVLELVNKDRRDNGAQAVHLNGTLTSMARQMAKDMIQRNFMNHVNPDGQGPEERARMAGIKGGVYENLSYDVSSFKTPSQAVRAAEQTMMAEPPGQKNHRYNILVPGHVSVGVGVAVRGTKVTMVQEFSDSDP